MILPIQITRSVTQYSACHKRVARLEVTGLQKEFDDLWLYMEFVMMRFWHILEVLAITYKFRQ